MTHSSAIAAANQVPEGGAKMVFAATLSDSKRFNPAMPTNIMVEVHRTGVNILERKSKVGSRGLYLPPPLVF